MNDAENWCERILNYQFSDRDLLAQALTHRSASLDNNERLEFLGDAVLALSISHDLYSGKPTVREGGLSRYRAELVRKESLVKMAARTGLAQHLILGNGERHSGVRQRDSVLANALEAVFGAILLDGGFEAANTVILELFHDQLATLPDEEELKDAKTRLQEYLQARHLPPPDYELLEVTGVPHARIFEVACRITEPGIETSGKGSSRRRAEQVAASFALEKFISD
ncbi:MAG: ribonuclease III [Chromatiales bacterium]|nr:ribonuclease III [Chromatiales bacterium]